MGHSAQRRALEKQASRDEDDRMLRDGEITPDQLRQKNHLLSGVDLSTFRMVSIGKRRIG